MHEDFMKIEDLVYNLGVIDQVFNLHEVFMHSTYAFRVLNFTWLTSSNHHSSPLVLTISRNLMKTNNCVLSRNACLFFFQSVYWLSQSSPIIRYPVKNTSQNIVKKNSNSKDNNFH